MKLLDEKSLEGMPPEDQYLLGFALGVVKADRAQDMTDRRCSAARLRQIATILQSIANLLDDMS